MRACAVALLDLAGNLIPIQSVTNPGGDTPNANQGPDKLIQYQTLGFTTSDTLADGFSASANSRSKWYDGNFVSEESTSVVRLSLASPASVGAYWLMTAFDVPRRDPVSWVFRGVRADGGTTVLDQHDVYDVPSSGSATMTFTLASLSPPPSMPLVSMAPPAAPSDGAFSTFEFVFTGVRFPPYDGVSLGASTYLLTNQLACGAHTDAYLPCVRVQLLC